MDYCPMHWCGGTWVWCDGACGTCTMWQFTTSDHTEPLKGADNETD